MKQLNAITVVRTEYCDGEVVAFVASFSATEKGKAQAERLFVALAKKHVQDFAEDESAEGICLDNGKASDGENTVFLLNSTSTDEEIKTILES